MFPVRNPEELDVALESITRSRPDALHVGSFKHYRDIRQIPDFAANMRLPAMYGTDQAFVQNGGLMAFGSNRTVAAQRVAQLVAASKALCRPTCRSRSRPTSTSSSIVWPLSGSA